METGAGNCDGGGSTAAAVWATVTAAAVARLEACESNVEEVFGNPSAGVGR